ncbi:MAG: hypothetical protein AMS18_06775 [Gemmatimonas sp. SG8_17]|nr:MAG: hypothetical protein AMS18_06775 [Gemmatimonas sp. SG8_17]
MARDTKSQVEEFAKQLEQALGENLISLLLYGPAVREEGTGDVATLLILRDAGPRDLRPIESHVNSWTRKKHPPPLIFTEREWRAATDVFPIEIEDMKEAHLLLRGANPLEGIETTRDDLRRELEREVRGKLLQLRAEFAAVASDGKALGTLLVASARTFFVLFRGVLRLVGLTPPPEPLDLVRDIGATTGIDPAAFSWILDKLSGRKVPDLKPHDLDGDRYLEQIERLASFVDSFDLTGSGNGSEPGSSE